MTIKNPPLPRVAFLCGKGGGDFRALIHARSRGLVDFSTVAFITTDPDSSALQAHRLEQDAVEPLVVQRISAERQVAFAAIETCLAVAKPDWIFLCGFTYLLPPSIVSSWKSRIINTHHALLPDHPGLFTKEKLVGRGEPEVGATVHLVDEGVDTGRILARARFPNFGLEQFDKILRYYRFVQDVLIIQVFRDLQHVSHGERVGEYNHVRFEPSIEMCIIEVCKGDHGFA